MKPIYKILLGAVVFCALVWLLLFIPHYRAKSALQAYRAQLKARGEKITVVELIPSVSAGDARAGRDLLAAVAMVGTFSNPPPRMPWVAPGRAMVVWAEAVMPDYDVSNCWPAFTASVRKHHDTVAALRAALQKPAFAFPVNYQAGFSAAFTHLVPVKRVSISLSAATIAALHERDTALAWENLKAVSDFVRLNFGESLEISQLVRMAALQIALNSTWEALQYPGFTASQLSILQANWDSFNLLDQLPPALSMERAMGSRSFVEMRSSFTNYSLVADLYGGGPEYDDIGQVLANLREGVPAYLGRHPRYWMWKWWGSYHEELFSMQTRQAALDALRLAQTNGAFVAALDLFNHSATNIQQNHSPWIRQYVLTTGEKDRLSLYLLNTADTENSRRMLVTAIALKRYRIDHGQYPLRLAELLPGYLPKIPIDLMDGKPLRYHRNESDSFLLYSVGEDGRDDGGDATPTQSAESKNKYWFKGRDAVWPAPGTPEEINNFKQEVLDRLNRKQGPNKLVPLPADLAPSIQKTN